MISIARNAEKCNFEKIEKNFTSKNLGLEFFFKKLKILEQIEIYKFPLFTF